MYCFRRLQNLFLSVPRYCCGRIASNSCSRASWRKRASFSRTVVLLPYAKCPTGLEIGPWSPKVNTCGFAPAIRSFSRSTHFLPNFTISSDFITESGLSELFCHGAPKAEQSASSADSYSEGGGCWSRTTKSANRRRSLLHSARNSGVGLSEYRRCVSSSLKRQRSSRPAVGRYPLFPE